MPPPFQRGLFLCTLFRLCDWLADFMTARQSVPEMTLSTTDLYGNIFSFHPVKSHKSKKSKCPPIHRVLHDSHVVLCLITSLQTHSHIHSYTLTCHIILTIHSHTSHTLNSHMTHISHQTLTIPGTTLTYQIDTHNHIYTYTQSKSHAQTQASLLRHNPQVLTQASWPWQPGTEPWLLAWEICSVRSTLNKRYRWHQPFCKQT